MVRSSASVAVNSCLILSRVKLMTLNRYVQLPYLMLSIKGTVWRTPRQVVVPLGKVFSGIPFILGW